MKSASRTEDAAEWIFGHRYAAAEAQSYHKLNFEQGST
jgi:hypothetical protein